MITKLKVNPIDKQIGQRLRLARVAKGLSQEKLGAVLGVTFQQIQKYERGMNRLSGSRLELTCRTLGVTPNDLVQVNGGDVAAESAKLSTATLRLAIRIERLQPHHRRAVGVLVGSLLGDIDDAAV